MKIGILGGTFNPVHLGHIKLAKSVFERLKLDKLIFVPAYKPPHKLDKKDVIPWRDRYKMIELAIESEPAFEVSGIEGRLKGPSYSINTIKEFKKIYGGAAEIFFITGSDSVEELKAWKDIENLKNLCTFVIATRPGYAVEGAPGRTKVVEADTPDISSTDIRRRIKENKPIKKLLPSKVYNYIIIRKLYL